MANENALKIIFQKKAPAYRILAFEGCFIGRSLALSQVSDRPHFREGLPINFHVDYVPFYDWRDPKGSQERALACLRQHLARYPNEHACMCFELIQGESGSYPGSRDFFEALMRLLKEKNIAVLVDEVQTFGRTDPLFAFQHFNLQNYIDVVTCGKLMHACATLFKAELRPKPALIAQTFLSATSLIQAALAILKSLLEDNFLGIHGKNLKMREHCIEHLQCLAHKYPHKLEGPFGYGLMVACTPFKGQKEQVVNFVRALFDAGLIVYTSGNNPTRLRMLIPAGGVTHEDIDQAFAIFEKILLTL
jgi:4-aminobutyrate aminotransferase-like enzyme